MSPRRVVALVVALALVAAGCGSRATAEQRALARRGSVAGTGAGAVSPGSGATATTTLDGAAATGATATGATVDASAGTDTQQATAAAAACENKGATDTGISATNIKLGNVATLSGPLPGLFESAQIGAQAVIAYQNSLGGICGRQLKMDLRDDQFDAGQNRSQTIDLLGSTFGMLGSFSLYDDAAAPEIRASGAPDASVSISAARKQLPNNFSVSPSKAGGWQTGTMNYLKAHYPDAISAVGTLYPDIAAAAENQTAVEGAARSIGFNFVYRRAYGATETDFTADVIRMRQNGVRLVLLDTADPSTTARLATAMAQQGFKPDVIASGVQDYDPKLLALAGAAAEGIVIRQTASLFAGEDAGVVPEVGLMTQWLQKVKPGFTADLYAAYAWAEGRLLFQAMQAAGPDLTRTNVTDQLQQIHQYDGNGLFAPADPAGKGPPTCFVVTTVQSGQFVRHEPAQGYICDQGGYYTG